MNQKDHHAEKKTKNNGVMKTELGRENRVCCIKTKNIFSNYFTSFCLISGILTAM